MRTVTVPITVQSVTMEMPVEHLCPFVDEVDLGELTIWFEPLLKTVELHAASRWVRRYQRITISHEDLVDEVLTWIVKTVKPAAAAVHGKFVTADIKIDVVARYQQPRL